MILDIRTDKAVDEMTLAPIADRVSEWHSDYHDRYVEHRGRWHVVYTDRSEGYLWGDEILFLP